VVLKKKQYDVCTNSNDTGYGPVAGSVAHNNEHTITQKKKTGN